MLSAVEGLKLVTPGAQRLVVIPITVVILVLLFAVQSRGTAKVATFFGPVMAGLVRCCSPGWRHPHISDDPGVVLALNPDLRRGVPARAHGVIGLVTLGAVFLAVTGAEALYADLGHFGRRPIQIAWLGFVLPGARAQLSRPGRLVLPHPAAIDNPFFQLVSRTGPCCPSCSWRRRPPSSPARP